MMQGILFFIRFEFLERPNCLLPLVPYLITLVWRNGEMEGKFRFVGVFGQKAG